MLSRLFPRPTLLDAAVAGGDRRAGDPRPPAAGPVRLVGVTKRYGERVALRGVTLDVAPGEIVAITGPSGAGKSTIGRLVSGLARPDAGSVSIGDVEVSTLPPQARRVAHMFESYALYPNLTVADNVASPLRAPASGRPVPPAERMQRVEAVLALAEIGHLSSRLPSQLSGGQKQRVALCRALVQTPTVYVLDEPLGHLDARLRHELRGEIRRRQCLLPQGTMWLTPDGLEALAVADRVVVLVDGQVLQDAAPETIHARPADVRVARLIGDPPMNVLPAFLGGETDAPTLSVAGARPEPVSRAFAARLRISGVVDDFSIGLRPTDLLPMAPDAVPPEGLDVLPATVYAVETLGKSTIVSAEVGGERVRAKLSRAPALRPGEPLRLAFPPDAALAFDAASGALLA